MIYTETEKKELDKVRGVFAEHLRQCPDFELLWSDKVGYVWLAIGLEPLYVDTGRRIESCLLYTSIIEKGVVGYVIKQIAALGIGRDLTANPRRLQALPDHPLM